MNKRKPCCNDFYLVQRDDGRYATAPQLQLRVLALTHKRSDATVYSGRDVLNMLAGDKTFKSHFSWEQIDV